MEEAFDELIQSTEQSKEVIDYSIKSPVKSDEPNEIPNRKSESAETLEV